MTSTRSSLLRAPRHPVVLCHGLFGFDRYGPARFPALQVHYWRDVSPALRQLGCKLHESCVPATGSVSQRAESLMRQVEALSVPSVNLIAHSMGGLDCRYMISVLGSSMRTQVATLTTISTPHRGSPFMDWCAEVFGVANAESCPSSEAEKKKSLSLDKQLHDASLPTNSSSASNSEANLFSHPSSISASSSGATELAQTQKKSITRHFSRLVDLPAYANLTTEYCCNVFNPNIADAKTTKYFSYGARADFPLWSPLRIPTEIVRQREGENDGLVSVRSSKWGTYLGTLDAHHWELTGNRWITPSGKKNFDAPMFYLGLVTKLWEMGH